MLHRLPVSRQLVIFCNKINQYICVNQIGGGGVRVASTDQRGQKRDRITDRDSSSDDDNSSLEESVEEHKQPQTEEIMNAELVARVIRIHLSLNTCPNVLRQCLLGNCPESGASGSGKHFAG